MTALVFRLIFSLGFIAVLLWFAARVAKKRGLGGSGRNLIEVVARQRMSRSSSVNVIRIVDRVFVVGATEEQITLLAEMDAQDVTAALPALPAGTSKVDGEPEDESEPVLAVPVTARMSTKRAAVSPGSGGMLAGSVFDKATWSAFVDSLRERTVRRS